MQARRSRQLTWRGEVVAEGRITTSTRVPVEQAGELLARSGRHGIIIDVTSRGRDQDLEELAKVKLPVEWDMAESLAKIDALPAHLKKATRGIIPGARGYTLRTTKEAEADIISNLTPDVADKLGPALRLRPTSEWIVRSIPRSATKEGIILALNSPTSRWRGLTVRPNKIVGQPRMGKG